MPAQNADSLTSTGSVVLTKPATDTLSLVQISGTYGTVTFVIEGTSDGTNYGAIAATDMSSGVTVTGTLAPADNATVLYLVSTPLIGKLRARVTAIASGQADFSLESHALVGVPSTNVVQVGQSVSGNTSFAAGLTFTGATGLNTLTMPDNLASALNIVSADAKSFVVFVTTDSSEAVQIAQALTLTNSTTPTLTTAAGKTNTGYVAINGKTSGQLKITAADATAQTVTLTVAAQTTGASTYTIPDAAGAAQTFVTAALAQTLTNKTLTAPVLNGASSASGNFDLSGSSGTFKSCTGTNTLGGNTLFKVIATPVAAAGAAGGVAGAAALGAGNVLTISSDGATKGVKLLTGVAGDIKWILNTSSTAANLFAASGGTINGGSADAGCAVAASKGVIAFCTAADTWTVFDFAAHSGAAA